jgi:acetolactate synthase-1/2/3 large subunit
MAKQINNISGAEAIIHCLLEEGVDILFGYPGGAIMPFYDELYKFQKELHHVLTRHEQGAAHAAQGYARVNGKVGVCVATSGPGATNLVTGIADAQIDSTPLVCITGQVTRDLLGSDAFQETDIVGISTPVTKWNYQITRAEEIPEVMAKAFYIARSGRPGPVLIDITKNAQFDKFDFSYESCKAVRSYIPTPIATEESLQEAASLINGAKKPMCVVGQGVVISEAEEAFKDFIEKSGIPTAWTILGKSALNTNHPLNVGMVGMHGNYAPNLLTNECDLLIAIGMRFDDRVTGDLNTYAKQAKVIHFDIDKAEINKNVTADVAVLGDAKESLESILPLLEKSSHPKWMEVFNQKRAIEEEKVIKHVINPSEGELTMAEVINAINNATQRKAVIVTDVGQHQMMTCRYAESTTKRSNITSGGLGTMGFGLPASIGAKIGAEDREVISIMGDGGFQMNLQELGTIFQTKVGVKIVILNNEHLGMVRQWQELFFDRRYASTVMDNPDFVKIAKGFDIPSSCVKERSDLKSGIQEMLDTQGPYLLEIKVTKEENVFPMIPSGCSVSDIRLS